MDLLWIENSYDEAMIGSYLTKRNDLIVDRYPIKRKCPVQVVV